MALFFVIVFDYVSLITCTCLCRKDTETNFVANMEFCEKIVWTIFAFIMCNIVILLLLPSFLPCLLIEEIRNIQKEPNASTQGIKQQTLQGELQNV